MKTLLLFIALTFGFQLVAQTIPDEYLDFYHDLEMKPYDEKFKMLDEVIEYYPEEPWFLWMKASVYSIMGNDELALENYQKSLELDSNFSGGHASLARFLSDDTTQLDRALEHINKAIQLEPYAFYYCLDRGEIYFNMKQYDKALEDAEFCLANDDPLYSSQLIIEILHAQNKRKELEAFLNDHDLSREGEFLGTNFCLLLASIYEELNENDKACRLYRGAAEPFYIMDEKLPDDLAGKLEKCK